MIIRSPSAAGRPRTAPPTSSTCVDKLDRGFDRAIYVLGADHHGTRKWYAAIARMLGYDPERVEVLLYQLVHLLRGGERTKMSKRSGDVVTLDELIDEIGVDAARWYLLSRGPDQTIEIDVDLAKEKSRRTPSTTSSTPMPGSQGFSEGRRRRSAAPRRPSSPTRSKGLVRRLLESPGSSPRRPSAADRTRSRPTRSASPTTSTASTTEHRVLESDAEAFRLGLCRATQTVVARCLDLVGVEAPERM